LNRNVPLVLTVITAESSAVWNWLLEHARAVDDNRAAVDRVARAARDDATVDDDDRAADAVGGVGVDGAGIQHNVRAGQRAPELMVMVPEFVKAPLTWNTPEVTMLWSLTESARRAPTMCHWCGHRAEVDELVGNGAKAREVRAGVVGGGAPGEYPAAHENRAGVGQLGLRLACWRSDGDGAILREGIRDAERAVRDVDAAIVDQRPRSSRIR